MMTYSVLHIVLHNQNFEIPVCLCICQGDIRARSCACSNASVMQPSDTLCSLFGTVNKKTLMIFPFSCLWTIKSYLCNSTINYKAIFSEYRKHFFIFLAAKCWAFCACYDWRQARSIHRCTKPPTARCGCLMCSKWSETLADTWTNKLFKISVVQNNMQSTVIHK